MQNLKHEIFIKKSVYNIADCLRDDFSIAITMKDDIVNRGQGENENRSLFVFMASKIILFVS